VVEACVVKWLTVVVLIIGAFSSTVFAGCADAKQLLNDRFRLWLQFVTVAESQYKSTHGHYGDLTDLRKAHLLDQLVFESDSPASGHGESAFNYVPKTTSFQVIVSGEGQHFKALIQEPSVSVDIDEMGYWSINGISCGPTRLPLLDSPAGPIIAIRG